MLHTESLKTYYSDCTLCPRMCHADRTDARGARRAVCGESDTVRAARAALHFWEEPCISGSSGSGAVFFSGCSLSCVFCQNGPISRGRAGLSVSSEKLSEIFLSLQEQGANNINLVTAAHFAPTVAGALQCAKDRGLTIPVVWNSSGYENTETLRLLDGLVDIYLPDFKYMDPVLSGKYSHAPDYFEKASQAVAEMVRQTGAPVFLRKMGRRNQQDMSVDGRHPEMSGDREFSAETELEQPADREDPLRSSAKFLTAAEYNALPEQEAENSRAADTPADHLSSMAAAPAEGADDCENASAEVLLQRGTIVRQLILPGCTHDAMHVTDWLYQTFGDTIYISLMSQYTPEGDLAQFPELARSVTKREYERVVDHALSIGVENAFLQEGGTAKESFIPDFTSYTGL